MTAIARAAMERSEEEIAARERLIAVLHTLSESYGRQVTAGMREGYWLAVGHLTEVQLFAAAKRALEVSRFMPTPAELLAFAGVAPPQRAKIALAWNAVRIAIDRHDYTASVDFGPLVNAVIRNLGGWDTLCRASLRDLDNPGWLRKRFEQVFEMFDGIPVERLNGAALRGLYDTKPVKVQIAGLDQTPALPPNREVRMLAEAKSASGAEVRRLTRGKP
jgi:hypothetical protein